MTERCYTPPQLAARWQCKPEIVRKMIGRGILPAFNVADPDATRPRWRVSLDVVLEYEAGQVIESPARPRRRRRQVEMVPEGPI